MALSFLKPGASKTTPSAPQQQAAAHTHSPAAQYTPPPKTPGGGLSFLKRGADSQAQRQAEQARAAERRAKWDKLRRFFLGYNESGAITFLDGDLGPDGNVDFWTFGEHYVKVGGKGENFICTFDVDNSTACPLCADGNKRSLVAVLTVIDHTPYTSTKGKNAGQTFVNQRKLFIAKETTLQQLNEYARKAGRLGLRGATFDVKRLGEGTMAPNVGSQFDFREKVVNPQVLMKMSVEDRAKAVAKVMAAKYKIAEEDCYPADYDNELVYIPAEKLLEMGLGKAHGTKGGIGYEAGVKEAAGDL